MTRRVLKTTLALLFGACFTLLLFLPFPSWRRAERGAYICLCEDGKVREVSYAAAHAALSGIGEDGNLLLCGEIEGEIEASEEFTAAYRLLEHGETADLLRCDFSLDPLERAALVRFCGDRLYYDDGYWYAFTGTFGAAAFGTARELYVLGGFPSAAEILSSGAERMHLSARAEVRASALVGASLTLSADEPYATREGGVFLNTAGGTRLVCGEPNARTVRADCQFCDEGALSPCGSVAALDLNFLGSSAYPLGSDYKGELGYLFLRDGMYRVPQSLKQVKVRGGVVTATAFYGCPYLEEIDLCGIPAADLSPQAFEGLGSLKTLHAARGGLLPESEYTCETAACGCSIYRRK